MRRSRKLMAKLLHILVSISVHFSPDCVDMSSIDACRFSCFYHYRILDVYLNTAQSAGCAEVAGCASYSRTAAVQGMRIRDSEH